MKVWSEHFLSTDMERRAARYAALILGSVFWAAASLGLVGCDRGGEPPTCLQKRQRARNLALQGELEPASRLLDEVKAECGANSASDIQHIGKLIAEKLAARRELERLQAEKRELREKFPGRDFAEWATGRDGKIAGKLASVSCGERGSAEDGFCEGRRSEAPEMSLRYWQAEPEAYRYALVSSRRPSCIDLGEHREVRSWSRDGADYELCELTNRRLRHLSALLVHGAAEHRMYIFSNAYLARDPGFEKMLRIVQPAR